MYYTHTCIDYSVIHLGIWTILPASCSSSDHVVFCWDFFYIFIFSKTFIFSFLFSPGTSDFFVTPVLISYHVYRRVFFLQMGLVDWALQTPTTAQKKTWWRPNLWWVEEEKPLVLSEPNASSRSSLRKLDQTKYMLGAPMKTQFHSDRYPFTNFVPC